jgi:hypothetical protein
LISHRRPRRQYRDRREQYWNQRGKHSTLIGERLGDDYAVAVWAIAFPL